MAVTKIVDIDDKILSATKRLENSRQEKVNDLQRVHSDRVDRLRKLQELAHSTNEMAGFFRTDLALRDMLVNTHREALTLLQAEFERLNIRA